MVSWDAAERHRLGRRRRRRRRFVARGNCEMKLLKVMVEVQKVRSAQEETYVGESKYVVEVNT